MMNQQRLSFWCSFPVAAWLIGTACVLPVQALQPPQENAAPNQPERGSLAVDQQKTGRIELLSRWLKTQSPAATESEDKAVDDSTPKISTGDIRVEDVVLDLETAQVAIEIVSWQHTDNSARILAGMPFSASVNRKEAAFWKQLSTDEPPQLNRQLAVAVYQAVKREVYWSKFVSKLPANTAEKFDREQFELISFKNLQAKKVVDLDDKPLGTIADLGINKQTGDIAYCVLKTEDGAMRAIPLGAFLHRDAKENWKIELASERILQFEPFAAEKVPQEIDRGWKEYVAIRYGRDALQATPEAKKPSPE